MAGCGMGVPCSYGVPLLGVQGVDMTLCRSVTSDTTTSATSAVVIVLSTSRERVGRRTR